MGPKWPLSPNNHLESLPKPKPSNPGPGQEEWEGRIPKLASFRPGGFLQ